MTEKTEQDFTPSEDEAQESKLTSWKNPPSLLDLKNDLTEARSAHDEQVTKINRWLDHRNGTGEAVVETPAGRSKLIPKLIRKQAEWRYANLSEPFLSTDDVFNVEPVSWEDTKAAQQNQLVLNNQINTKLNKTKFIDDYIRAGVDEGTIIVRTGWEYEETTRMVEQPVIEYIETQDPNVYAQHQEIHALMETPEYENLDEALREAHDIFMETGKLVIPQETDELEEVEEIVILKNNPTAEVLDNQNVIVDPTAQGDPDKVQFIINSFESSLSDLEKDGNYKNLDKINLEAAGPLNEPDYKTPDDSAFNFKDKARRKFIVYEYWGYWDIDDSGMTKAIVVSWVGNTIIRMEENPYPDGKLPFVIVPYLPVTKSIYGEPDGELLIDNQKIMGAITRGMVDIMARSANGQMGYAKNALDVTNKRKFDRGEDYEFNPGINPDASFHMHTYPEIPRSAEFMLSLTSAESESLTGIKAFNNGISGQALGDTATGIRSALDSASKRELGILRRLADGIKQIGRKFIAMNAEFLEEEETIRITNEEFVTIRRDDLPGNFDLRLIISTAEADNQKAQELAFMLQTMGNNMDQGMSQMILGEIARLRKMPELAKRIEEYQPQPDPMQQRIAELQVAKLEAEVRNENAKGAENEVDVDLKSAKAETERAKARQLGSMADLSDLDFVEQQSGTKQERELQKQDRKADSDRELKALDNLVKLSSQSGANNGN